MLEIKGSDVCSIDTTDFKVVSSLNVVTKKCLVIVKSRNFIFVSHCVIEIRGQILTKRIIFSDQVLGKFKMHMM